MHQQQINSMLCAAPQNPHAFHNSGACQNSASESDITLHVSSDSDWETSGAESGGQTDSKDDLGIDVAATPRGKFHLMLAAPLPPAQLRKAYNLTLTMMKHKLRLLLTNVFCLKSKLSELQHTAKTRCADIIIVSETRFSPEKISDSEASLPGYAPPIRCDRNENGGGVAV